MIVAGLIKENQEWSAGCRVTLVGRTKVPAFSATFLVGQLSHRMKKDFGSMLCPILFSFKRD